MRRPPRLIARTLIITFLAVAGILSLVFAALTVDVRNRVLASETDKLRIAERMFNALEARRQQEQLGTISTLAENPALKAAVDTYYSELKFAGGANEQARATAANEAARLAPLTGADVLAIIGSDGRVFTSAGRLSSHWSPGLPVDVPEDEESSFQDVVVLSGGAFRTSAVPLRLDADQNIGWLMLGTSLDRDYASELSALSGAGVAIVVDDQIVASTLDTSVTRNLASVGVTGGFYSLNGEGYAIRTLLSTGSARIYTLSSVDAAARTATREALAVLSTIAFAGLILAGVASFWLARTISEPINHTSNAIATMTAARDYHRKLDRTGTSRELDSLADAFNELMQGLAGAEIEMRSTYLGAIRALAAALDARDPYTAGHSERVSAYSVMIGQQMGLDDNDISVLRLGALLHDIGKIGIPDEILRKPGPLTAGEFEQIKLHPALGARILRQVPFLAPHLSIVELHHERPDGEGYPFGLRGEETPLAARIVHVADAYDAMTSARAYRPARPANAAMAELRRYAGTQFDPASVEALCAALPGSRSLAEPMLQELLGRAAV